MVEEQTVTTETKKETAPEQKEAGSLPFPVKAILGQKVGMTQIFLEKGERVPVTVIYAGNCFATEVRTLAKNGYNAVQLGAGECKEKNLPKSVLEEFRKKNLKPLKWLKEFRVEDSVRLDLLAGQIGRKVPVSIFSPGNYVDVSGISKGKGFAGAMKRHGFHGMPASHGTSDKVRSPGSSAGGSGAPQRVYKGSRRAGRMGGEWVTTQKLEVVKVDPDNDLILVKGSVPGVSKGLVIVKETSKSLKQVRVPQVTKVSPKKAAVAKKQTKAPAAPVKK